ncbi:MAG: M23 family metallopeptidase, partial [Chloroflexi bacterium]
MAQSADSNIPQEHPAPAQPPGWIDLFIRFSLAPGQVALALPQQLEQLARQPDRLDLRLSHGVVILVVLLAVWLSRAPLSWQSIRVIQPLRAVTSAPAVPEAVPEDDAAPLTLSTRLVDAQDDVLLRAGVPHTIIPDRTREQISTYVVQSGDTIFGIAAKFGLQPETILWANHDLEQNPDWLWVGQELTILPVDGVYHQVGEADTIETIAAAYKVEPEAIINYPLNNLDPDTPTLQPGQWLVVPGGEKPFVPRTVTAYSGPLPENAATGTGSFGWPTSGTITQGYWTGHPALDIASVLGAPIRAADSGHVIYAGWDDTGYGNMVVIDHGNGFQTLYAHMSVIYVSVGDDVAKGEQIGEMGSTGNSTGPHL